MANDKRLIDGNKAQAVLANMAEHLMEAGNPEMAGAVGYAAEVIGNQRTVDAVEVVYGRWEKCWQEKSRHYFRCSNCQTAYMDGVSGAIAPEYGSRAWRYCPNCGAKMDGERKDK